MPAESYVGMRPMEEATQAVPAITQRVRECDEETRVLREYCEAKFQIGLSTERRLSITGEPYVELATPWLDGYPTPAVARQAAITVFNQYAEGKDGALYWRVPPQIAYGEKQQKFAYYMRLLISSKKPIIKES